LALSSLVEWEDLVRGLCRVDCASLSDPVLVREDGAYLYTLTSVVDDIAMRITHVIRGEDHVTNTGPQIQIFAALPGPDAIPTFGHHNLLTSVSGEGLSKRSGALSLAGLRAAGIESLAVAVLAGLTGSSESVRPVTSLEEVAQLIDLSHISRHASKFDEAELAALSAKTLQAMSFADIRERLVLPDVSDHEAEAFWNAVRPNVSVWSDVKDWIAVAFGKIEPIIEDAEFARIARQHLPPQPWDMATFGRWASALKQQTKRQGKGLFHPLRLALTGRENGPELAALLPLIGHVKASAQLSGSCA
jgi:glutamyl-tRNA synthetase